MRGVLHGLEDDRTIAAEQKAISELANAGAFLLATTCLTLLGQDLDQQD
jgi:hypothetical protein